MIRKDIIELAGKIQEAPEPSHRVVSAGSQRVVKVRFRTGS